MNTSKKHTETTERWRYVKGYRGLYMVSNLGNVMVLPRAKRPNGRIVKPRINNSGYARVLLTNCNGKSKEHSVHRLVAIAFIKNPFNYDTVNHRDFNKLNNAVSNLEWMSLVENYNHYLKNWKGQMGGRRSKLTVEQVERIYHKYYTRKNVHEVTTVTLAREYGVSNPTISKVIRNAYFVNTKKAS